MAHSRETQTQPPQLLVNTALPHSETSASPGAQVALNLTLGLCGQLSPHLPEVTSFTRTHPLLQSGSDWGCATHTLSGTPPGQECQRQGRMDEGQSQVPHGGNVYEKTKVLCLS